MAKIRPITIDFETERILPRPHYPPKPVGFSIKRPGERKSTYYAWGHPTKNNCTLKDAKRILKEAWTSGQPLLFQNAKFDVDVAETHMDCPPINPLLIHDTLYLIYLYDPHAFTFSLKPAAEKILGMPPTEQQAVAHWLIEHQDELRRDGLLPAVWDNFGKEQTKITLSNFGAWICLAPGDLVGKYADGDVVRTEKLFNKLHPEICERGMEVAYDRERRLMPILLRNEREGMRVDERGLARDVKVFDDCMAKCDQWLRKTLKSPDMNIDSDEELATALDNCGIVTEWTVTPKSGKRSTSKKNMKLEHFKKPQVFHMLGYRSRLHTLLNTFMRPFLAEARITGGLVHANWNQVRQSKSKDSDVKGTRTGRLSVSRFMNMPKDFDDKGDGYQHPTAIDLTPLALMRGYVLPDAKDHWWGRRDYNQQELRILAHFEDGALLEAYNDNPYLDTHKFVQTTISELLNKDIPRTPVKTLNFGYIYGQGIPSMAEKLNVPVEEVRTLRNAQIRALPGLGDLDKMLKGRGKAGEPIRTWGGREYYCEPPQYSEKYKRNMTFEYKLLNYLIQGSAADCTKEALIRYDEVRKDGRLVVTVHDEIDISAPKKAFKEEMLRLREAMMSVEFDVPMLSDAEYGPNWGALKDLKEPSPFN